MAPDRDNIIHFPGDGSGLHLRVDLLLLPSPVWRSFVLPGAATFWDLHAAIQDTFGWEDRHLHQFTVDDQRNGSSLRLGLPEPSGPGGTREILAGWEHRIARHLRPGLPAALYTYDFGDNWQHEVEVLEVLVDETAGNLPRCTGGQGWIPGEDSGGAHVAAPEVTIGAVSFAPEAVEFTNPRTRWRRQFGHE